MCPNMRPRSRLILDILMRLQLGAIRFMIKQIFWNTIERRLRSFWRLGLFVGVYYLFTEGFIIILLFISGMIDVLFGVEHQSFIAGVQPMQFMSNPLVGFLAISGATCLVALGTTFLFGKWIDHRKFKEFGFKLSKIWWQDFAFGITMGAFLMGLIFLFGWITGMVNVRGFFVSFIADMSFVVVFIQSLLLFVFVGVYEEIVFRGYLLINLAEGLNLKILGKTWALVISIMLTSMIFGVMHMDNPNATWVSTTNIMLAGIFLGMGMFLTGSLAIPIGLHISWNFFQGSVFGFPVSGMHTAAAMIATESAGPAWLTGGAFGPEGGALGLIAILVGSGLTLLWLRRRGRLSFHTELGVYNPIYSGNKENPVS